MKGNDRYFFHPHCWHALVGSSLRLLMMYVLVCWWSSVWRWWSIRECVRRSFQSRVLSRCVFECVDGHPTIPTGTISSTRIIIDLSTCRDKKRTQRNNNSPWIPNPYLFFRGASCVASWRLSHDDCFHLPVGLLFRHFRSGPFQPLQHFTTSCQQVDTQQFGMWRHLRKSPLHRWM